MRRQEESLGNMREPAVRRIARHKRKGVSHRNVACVFLCLEEPAALRRVRLFKMHFYGMIMNTKIYA